MVFESSREMMVYLIHPMPDGLVPMFPLERRLKSSKLMYKQSCLACSQDILPLLGRWSLG